MNQRHAPLKNSWAYSIGLAFCLFTPAIATAIAVLFNSSSVWLAASSLGMLLPLIIFRRALRPLNLFKSDGRILSAFLVLHLAAIVLGGLDYEFEAVLRSGYIGLLFLALPLVAQRIEEEEMRRGLILFALVEAAFCLSPAASINPNGLTVRIITAGAVIFLAGRRIWFRALGLLVAGAGILVYEGRTALMALGFTAVLYLGWRLLARRRLVMIAGFLAMMIAAGSFMTSETRLVEVLGTLPQWAIQAASKGRGDKFIFENTLGGREVFWNYSFALIRERPILGYGSGYTNGGFDILWCHNSFLRVFVEYGYVGGGFLILYYLAAMWFLARLASQGAWFAELGYFLGAFMFFVGWLESIGIGSLLTPANILFHLMTFYSLSQMRTHAFRNRLPARRTLGSAPSGLPVC